MIHHFVIPNPDAFPSGGNQYNASLTQALQDLGVSISIMDWDAFMNENGAGLFWIDTLYLDQFDAEYSRKPGQQLGLLVHYLASMYPPAGSNSYTYFQQHEAAVLARFDAFLVTSPFTEAYLIDHGCEADSILVVPPGLPWHSTDKISSSLPLRALMVANLTELKGVLPLLKALADRIDRLGDFNLTIVGSEDSEPHYAASCRAFLRKHPALRNRVHFTGALAHEAIFSHYKSTNLFLSASQMETFGMAVQEAMAVGLPILARNVGYLDRLVLDGKNGYLYDSLSDMADTVVALSQNESRLEQLIVGADACKPDPAYDWLAAGRRYLIEQQNIEWRISNREGFDI